MGKTTIRRFGGSPYLDVQVPSGRAHQFMVKAVLGANHRVRFNRAHAERGPTMEAQVSRDPNNRFRTLITESACEQLFLRVELIQKHDFLNE
jgi:hypothetical protein